MAYSEDQKQEIMIHLCKMLEDGHFIKNAIECLPPSASTIYEWISENPNFSDSIKRASAKGIVLAESHLFQAAKKGNIAAIIYFLKCKDPENWNQDTNNDSSYGSRKGYFRSAKNVEVVFNYGDKEKPQAQLESQHEKQHLL